MLTIYPPIFAHRGARSLAPENTLAAFRKAHELGITWIECDVMLSKDHQVIVLHDDQLGRTSSGQGAAIDFTYQMIQQLDAGSWFSPDYANEKIPLLSEVIDFLRVNKMSANVEIKALPGLEVVTTEKVMAIIEKYWTPDMLPPLVSSFSWLALQKTRELSPTINIGLLMHEWLPEWQVRCEEINCVSLDVNHEIITPAMMKLFKDAGRLVFCYTVNDPKRAKELFSFGVDAVYSDCPDIILKSITQ